MARAGLTVELLARAGAELADEVGFEHVTVSAVARRFDVKVASLYSHVRGSDDLRTRIARLALEELADLGSAAVAGRSGKDALVAYADVYRSYAHEHPGRYAASSLRLTDATALAGVGSRHAELSRSVLRGYGLTGADQTHAVRLLGSLVHGFTTLELGGGFDHSEPDSQTSWARVLDALDALLRGWPAP